MPWGLFGPISYKTRRGSRITFIAGFITLPLTAVSLYQLFRSRPIPEPKELGSSRRAEDLTDI